MHASGDSQAQAIVLLGTNQTLPLLEVQTAKLTASIRHHQERKVCIITAMHLYKKRATKQVLLRWACTACT